MRELGSVSPVPDKMLDRDLSYYIILSQIKVDNTICVSEMYVYFQDFLY